jgi:hypothetical protein
LAMIRRLVISRQRVAKTRPLGRRLAIIRPTRRWLVKIHPVRRRLAKTRRTHSGRCCRRVERRSTEPETPASQTVW